MQRTVRHEQLHPNVAVALRRVPAGWLIVINPGLTPKARLVAEAQANMYVDAFEMGWSYVPPAGGTDVIIETAFMGVAGVTTLPERPVGVAIAGAFLAPLAACAWIVQNAVAALAPAIGA